MIYTAVDELVSVWKPATDLLRPVQFPFTFHEVQEEYFIADSPVVLNIGANRIGKSSGAHCDNIWRAHGVHPYKQVPLIETLWSGFPDFPFYNKVTRKMFLSLVPRRLLLHWSESDKHAVIRRVDGGTCDIWFVSYEQAVTSWTGDAVGHIHLDEPVPEEHFNEAAARVATTEGQIYITVTPVNGLGWMEERLYLPAANKSGENPDVHVIEGGLAEYDEALEKRDRASLGIGRIKVPHFTRESVTRFARQYRNPAERMIRVFGIYKRRTGGVYADFDPTVHVVPAFAIPRHYEMWGGCDSAYYFAVVLNAMDEKGRIYTAYEYFSSSGETADQRVATMWREITLGRTVEQADDTGRVTVKKYPPVCPWLLEPDAEPLTIYIDTAALQDSIELNAAAARLDAKLIFTQLDQKLKAVDAAVRMVQNWLAPSTARETPDVVHREEKPEVGEPRLYFFDNLYSEWVHKRPGSSESDEGEFMAGSRLCWELKNFQWLKPKPHEAHSAGPDKNSAGGAHAENALRYSVMARVSAPQKPEGERQETPHERRVREHRERLAELSQRGA
jgi:phage terminase large subunit-like protein